jgi:acetylornithine deacetylase
MKGFLAVVLAALPRMVAADLQRPILLALTYDEEIGTVGAPSAVEGLLATFPRPAAVLVGEPTLLRVVTAHKGVRSFTTTVTGRDGHSSQPQLAANAVAAVARIATFIDDLAASHRDAATDHPSATRARDDSDATRARDDSDATRARDDSDATRARDDSDATRARDDRFDPPYTTFNLATVAGGQAINIVPRWAQLTWEYRPVPADDGDAIRDEVQRFVDAEVLPRLRAATGTGDVVTVSDAVARTLGAEEDGVAERLARELSGDDQPAGTVPFGTDGGHFQAAGLSTVVCGPGSIEQAHQPDEWIATEQLEACEVVVDRLIERLADGPVGPAAPDAATV